MLLGLEKKLELIFGYVGSGIAEVEVWNNSVHRT